MSGSPVGRREVAVRCFAAEFDDASLEYSESDEERAPNYVVTPAGTRINRLFVVGVLTEVEPVSDDVLRGRVVDPTGAFVVYAGQYQPDAKTALERLEPPAFVAVTGKARTFEPDDGDRVYTSIRPESVNAVDAATRDRWTVQAAEHTLSRIAMAAAAVEREERGDALRAVLETSGVDPALAAGIPRAIEHYGTTPAYLAAVRAMALQAAEVVAGERDEVEPLDVEPDAGGSVDDGLAAGVELAAAAGSTGGGEGEATAAEGADEPPAAADTGGPTADEVTDDAPVGAGEPDVEEAAEETEAEAANEEAEVAEEETEAEEPAATATDEAGATDGTEATDELGDFDVDAGGTVDAGTADASAAAGEDEPAAGETGLYELDESEIDAVEEEYGTEFSTGNEVDGAGEADIATPEPDEAEAPEEPESTAADAEASAEAPADGGGEDAGEVDLVEAVVSAMEVLDEGDGAERTAVIESVSADHGVDEAAVEDAIDEALMAGRCYEPDDDHLTAI